MGHKPSDIIVDIDEVPDEELKILLKEVTKISICILTFSLLDGSCKDVDKLRSLFKNCEIILETGFTKPLATVQLDDIPNIVQTATLHRVILRSLAELSQFQDGIHELGVAYALLRYPNLYMIFLFMKNLKRCTDCM